MAEASTSSTPSVELRCSTCERKKSLIITCESKKHTFCQCCVTACVESRTTAYSEEAGAVVTGLTCPLAAACGSQLETYLLQDIMGQIPKKRQEGLVIGKLRRRNSVVACPNHECPFYFYHEDPNFDVLFISCPGCREAYCLTCKNRLSSQGFRDHICPTDRDVDITDADASRQIREVLNDSLSIRCPSNQCQSLDEDTNLAGKEPWDCNAIKCANCRRFFCFICSKDLGAKRQDAHNEFPHRNAKRTDAPRCWLFDDEERGLTEDRALQIRQVIAVTKFLSSLCISDERKTVLLYQNRELLGEDIFTCLTKPTGQAFKKGVKCVFM